MLRDIKEFKKLGLDQSKFAEYINMNKSLFRSYVSGVKRPGKEQLIKINAGIKKLGNELKSIKFINH